MERVIQELTAFLVEESGEGGQELTARLVGWHESGEDAHELTVRLVGWHESGEVDP